MPSSEQPSENRNSSSESVSHTDLSSRKFPLPRVMEVSIFHESLSASSSTAEWQSLLPDRDESAGSEASSADRAESTGSYVIGSPLQ